MTTSDAGVRVGEGVPPGALSPHAPAFRAFVFDFDGVILDTAWAKTDAFRTVASRYGEEYGVLMAEYHRTAGSIGRRARWEHFFAHILELDPEPGEVDEMCRAVGRLVRLGTLVAQEVPGVLDYIDAVAPFGVHLVSGIEEEELRDLVSRRGFGRQFLRVRGGDKHRILRQMVQEGDIPLPAVYFGDTPDDEHAARAAGMDFVFVAGCSEFTVADFPEGTAVIEDFREVLA